MAADKALIAGAAKVAGAKAKLDNATLDAFTDLGEEIGQHAENVLASMQENEEARDEAINEGLSTINSQSIKPPNDHVGTLYDTPSTQEIYNKPVGTLTNVLDIQGTNFNYDAQTMQNQDVMDQQKDAQTMQNVVTSEMDKRNGYLAQVQTPGFNYNPLYDIESEDGKAAQAYLDGTAKWESKESGGKPNSFGYKVGDNFYTTSQMEKIVGNATAPDISKNVFNSLDDSSKRSFSTASNNVEADEMGKRIANEILGDESTLNNFLVHRTGYSLQTMRSKGNFDEMKINEVNEFINEQRAMHYDAPSAEPTLTPNKLYDINQDKQELEKFNAYLDTVTLGRGGLRSGFQKPTLEGWVNSKAGIKSLSEGGFSLAKIEYEEGPPDISLVNDANGRKSKLEPEMLKTRDMDYIKNVMRALKKLN